ncbi:MAG: patatin-like phospholipase family protein [Pseudomonadota bacterium]
MPRSKLDREIKSFGKTVLVLQGGGALGAYQIGVYEALSEAKVEPDWVIGTSIGAINASIIAGNAPEDRVPRLEAFWNSVTQDSPFQFGFADATAFLRDMGTLTFGLPGFFRPNLSTMLNPFATRGAETAGFYSTEPLRETLSSLIDFDRINRGVTRLTVGAASVSDSEMRYFDSADEKLGLDHTMASGALPPAFPPVRIGGQLYWDGGLLSNTPIEHVFEEEPRRDAMIITVQLWNHEGAEPASVWQAMNRQKDLQFSSRADAHIERQRELHRLRHVIGELAKHLPDAETKKNYVQGLTCLGCASRLHVIRLLAPPLEGETQFKDIDFSASGIQQRRSLGYRDTKNMLARAPWRDRFDEREGLILHDCRDGMVLQPPSV